MIDQSARQRREEEPEPAHHRGEADVEVGEEGGEHQQVGHHRLASWRPGLEVSPATKWRVDKYAMQVHM